MRIFITSLMVLTAMPLVANAQGTCVGHALIAGGGKGSGEGPDFHVDQFKTDTGIVEVYVGCCSEVSDDKRTLFLTIDRQKIFRTAKGSRFSGYLAVQRREADGDVFETQLHFFGDGLSGDDRDKVFFRGVRFGRVAAAVCEKKNIE